MKGYRFYEEFHNKRRGVSMGTVIAVVLGEDNRPFYHYYTSQGATFDAVAGVFDTPNSPVCGTTTTDGYLREDCKRISEARAREIHPALFEYLD